MQLFPSTLLSNLTSDKDLVLTPRVEFKFELAPKLVLEPKVKDPLLPEVTVCLSLGQGRPYRRFDCFQKRVDRENSYNICNLRPAWGLRNLE